MFSQFEIALASRLASHCYSPDDPLWEPTVRKMLTFVCAEMSLQCSLYVDDEARVVYCATDGTGDLLTRNGQADMWRNLQVLQDTLPETGASAHGGYTDAAVTISLGLEAQLLEAETRGYKTTFVGHSAGGAIALLLAMEFRGDCITFGQPRACSAGTIKKHFRPYYRYLRVVNGSDLIPRVIPHIPWRYGHGGELLYLPINPEKPGVWNASMWSMLWDRMLRPLGRRLRDHSSKDYILGLKVQYANPPKT